MLGFDLETTGIDVWNDRIVTASLVEIRMGQRPQLTNWLVNPGIDIPEGATEVHGITTEVARANGRDPGQATFEISGRLAYAMSHGIPVVVFNGAYDFTLLEEENRRHGNPTLAERVAPKPIGPIVDIYVLDKHVDPYRKGGRKLINIAEHYGAVLTDAHSADGDALASCRIFPRLLAKHRELQGYPLGALHMAQVRWRAEQMNSLRAYFDKNGTEHDGCNGGWPLRTDRPMKEAS